MDDCSFRVALSDRDEYRIAWEETVEFDKFSGQALHMKKTVVSGTSDAARQAALADAPPGVKLVHDTKILGVDQSLIRAKRLSTAAGRAEKAIAVALRVAKLPFDHETRGILGIQGCCRALLGIVRHKPSRGPLEASRDAVQDCRLGLASPQRVAGDHPEHLAQGSPHASTERACVHGHS